ncbi:MAG: DUF1700 domain-containing protein [Lachnospiraceae bacterium]
MKREDFMKQLEKLLTGMAEDEKRDALAFYENYFEDAGMENEEKVIEELESPEKLAASIKKDCLGEQEHEKEKEQEKEEGSSVNVVKQAQSNSFYKEHRTLCIVLVVIAILCTSPLWGGLLGGVLGAICGAFGLLIGIIAGLVGIVIGCSIGGIFAIGFGCVELVSHVGIGMIMIGVGLLMTVIAILALLLLFLLCSKTIPWIFKGAKQLWSKIFPKGEIVE